VGIKTKDNPRAETKAIACVACKLSARFGDLQATERVGCTCGNALLCRRNSGRHERETGNCNETCGMQPKFGEHGMCGDRRLLLIMHRSVCAWTSDCRTQ